MNVIERSPCVGIRKCLMSTSSTLKLALELAAKVTGREDLAALAGEAWRMSDYACRLIAPTPTF